MTGEHASTLDTPHAVNGRLRIGFMGEDHWARHLAEGLNARFPDSVECRHVTSYANPKAVWDTARLLHRSDLVVRVGFPPTVLPPAPTLDPARSVSVRDRLKQGLFSTGPGRVVRACVLTCRFGPVWRRRAAMDRLERRSRRTGRRRTTVYYWIGSDVLLWLDDDAAGADTAARVRRLRGASITGALHLSDELRTLGIDSETVPFPGAVIPAPEPVPEMPAKMTVVSYVPAGRPDFYGLPELLEAATHLPDVRFRVFGGASDAGGGPAPDNVEYLGRVDDLCPVYADSSVVARLVRHDAVGATVTEGLLYARPVLYSLPLPHTIHVPFGDSSRLVSALQALRRDHMRSGINPNVAGREWARVEFDVERRFSRLRDFLVSSGGAGAD